MVRHVLRSALPVLVWAAVVFLASSCANENPGSQTTPDTAAADTAADTTPTDTPPPDLPGTPDQAAEVTVDLSPEVTPDLVPDGPAPDLVVDSPPDTVVDTNPVTDATDAIDVVTVCGAIGDPITNHTPFFNESDTGPSAHSYTGPCITGDAPEHLYHIDLSGAGGNSDLVAYADCSAIGFNCALYLFSGPADACNITAGDVSGGDTICVDETSAIGSSWERLEASDLAPGHYWLAVDGEDGSDGRYDLWIKVSDTTDDDCRLHHEADITADFTIEDQNSGTGFDRLRFHCDGGETEGSPEHVYPIDLSDAGSITFDLTCSSISDAYDCVVGFAWALADSGCGLEQEDMADQFIGCMDGTTFLGDEEGCLNAAGGRYYLFVDGHDGAMGGYDLEIELGETITDEPCLLENTPATCNLRVNDVPITDDIIIVDSTADDADEWFLPNLYECDDPDQGTGTGDAVWELEIDSPTEVEFSVDCAGDCALVLIDADPSGVCNLTDLTGADWCEDGVLDESFTRTLAAGNHYIIVTSEDTDAVLEYELEIDFKEE